MQEGKIKYLGLSEASIETTKKAHIIQPVTTLQSKYSLFYRKLEKEIIPTLEELEICLVPLSPLG
ncbi:MAG: aldo/keto reductase [Apibacter sp.]|uniref:aldo/keto reductase n=1 Tax=Apibacter sp. TaxID=2023709 RepID=UPI0025F910AE|nr:aldo/keto reductase [Apibacter sp.]MCT6869765.1 aldo/keto reductase [Apibacter sp.]